jgi:NhaA family Na+:H+ antiporter
VALWLAMHEAGLHATLAGVVLGLLAPTRPARQPELVDAAELADVSSPEAARHTVTLARESVSVVEWLEHTLHPWTGFVIVPLFALANAGIPLGGALGDAVGSPVAAGVVLGLVVGKPLGIVGATWLAVRFGGARLPDGAAWRGIVAVGVLAGIGFTVSILVAGLAFEDPLLVDEAKLAILAASVLAGLGGLGLMAAAHPSRSAGGG